MIEPELTLDGEESVWTRFVVWLPSAPPSDHPGQLLRQYRTHLNEKGVEAAAIGGHLAVITRLMRTREDGWQQIFNSIFKSTTPGFTLEPNALLMAAIESRKPGTALDAGMGQGRNAIYLASKGWAVTGFDVADEGLAIARNHAARAGVAIRTVQTGGRAFDYGTANWDLILLSYVPFPIVEEPYAQKLYAALRPGGLLVIESFGSDAGAAQRRPVDLDPVQLQCALERFEMLRMEDTTAVADWTLEKTRVIRSIAQKPISKN